MELATFSIRVSELKFIKMIKHLLSLLAYFCSVNAQESLKCKSRYGLSELSN